MPITGFRRALSSMAFTSRPHSCVQRCERRVLSIGVCHRCGDAGDVQARLLSARLRSRWSCAGRQSRCSARRRPPGWFCLRMDHAIANTVQMAGVTLREALAMATVNPARICRIAGRQRGLQPGEKADMVRFAWSEARRRSLSLKQSWPEPLPTQESNKLICLRDFKRGDASPRGKGLKLIRRQLWHLHFHHFPTRPTHWSRT